MLKPKRRNPYDMKPETPFRQQLRLWLVVGCLMVVIARIVQYGITGDRIFMLIALSALGFLNAPDRNE